MPSIGKPKLIGTKKQLVLKPYWQTADGKSVKLFLGDVLETLKRMPSKSVQMLVTSPPYWNLRDYGADKKYELGSEATPQEFVANMVAVFREARRVLRDDGTCWVNMGDTYASGGNKGKGTADVSDEWEASQERASKNGYNVGGWGASKSKTQGAAGRAFGNSGLPSGNLVGIPWRLALALQEDGWVLRQDIIWYKPSPMPESCTNRCTKAHEYVFLLTKGQKYFYDAEAIREIAKYGYSESTGDDFKQGVGGLNGEPERGKRTVTPGDGGDRNKRSVWTIDDERGLLDWMALNEPAALEEYLTHAVNKLDVWKIASQGYPGSHFATFAEKLIEPMILAGTSEYGACVKCGSPWKRVTEKTQLKRDRPNDYVKRNGEKGTGNSCANSVAGVEVATLGWEPTCECHGKFIKRKVKIDGKTVEQQMLENGGQAFRSARYVNNASYDNDGESRDISEALESKGRERAILEYQSKLPLSQHPVRPCIVLDIFMGSATTAVVCLDKGRWAWGIELNEKYILNNAIPRVEGAIYSRPGLSHLLRRNVERLDIGDDISD